MSAGDGYSPGDDPLADDELGGDLEDQDRPPGESAEVQTHDELGLDTHVAHEYGSDNLAPDDPAENEPARSDDEREQPASGRRRRGGRVVGGFAIKPLPRDLAQRWPGARTLLLTTGTGQVLFVRGGR